MKRILIALVVFLGLSILKADAQYVAVRPGFSVGISVGVPGPAPFAGALWVGPEWTWREGRYVEVPGYWERPYRHHHAWVGGHWRYERRGYSWVPGHWR